MKAAWYEKQRRVAFAFGVGMPYPRVIPHSDGAGRVDQLGAGVPFCSLLFLIFVGGGAWSLDARRTSESHE